MSDTSPLFISSIELLAHATELFSTGNEKKYKFVILHLANSIELILKDRLIDKGVSIYIDKKPQTITIWEAFERLEKVKVAIPERPVIELLIDDRNTIQHRFGYPNADAVYYYLRRTTIFFTQFLEAEYNVSLSDTLHLYLPEEALALMGLYDDTDYRSLNKLAMLSPEAAILQAYNMIEKRLLSLYDPPINSSDRPFIIMMGSTMRRIATELHKAKYIPTDMLNEVELFVRLRNRAAHSAHYQADPPPQWGDGIDFSIKFLRALDKAIKDGFKVKRPAGPPASAVRVRIRKSIQDQTKKSDA
jgi:hypothetical protein